MPEAPPTTPAFTHAKRRQESLLAPLERRTLRWIVERLPAGVSSDGLTMLALLSMLLAGMCFWLSRYHRAALFLVPLCLALNWFGDSLDGTLARFRNQQRPRFGFYVDHLCDCLSVLFISTGMAASGLMSPVVAGAVVIAFLLVSVEAYLTAYTLGQFHISVGYFSPTELRILLAIGVLLLYRWPFSRLFGHHYLSLDVGGVCAVVGMAAMFLILSGTHTAQLFREEKLPPTPVAARQPQEPA